MKAIVSVIGQDKKGIIAKVSTALYDMNINIEDISQTIMQDFFTMSMLVDTAEASVDFKTVRDTLTTLGKQVGVDIRIQSEQIFTAMHRV